MATTGKFNGTLLGLYINDGGTYEKIAHATTHGLDLSTAMIDTTTKDSSGWFEALPGLRNGKASVEGIVVFDEGSSEQNWDQLYAAWTGRTKLTVRWNTGVTGDTYYQADAYVDSLSMGAPMEDKVTFSGSLQFTSAITTGTNP